MQMEELRECLLCKMGKPPKKKSLADKVRKTKTSSQIKNNAFEVKINRKKFDVLGRKSKHDVGLPGVSRSKAINKRKDTLLKEFRLKNKANKFVDRRFGEYDTKMAPEDKILQRFALERQRTQAKKDIYNLNEEEELTHYGQSLAEIEKLTDMVDSDSDSDEKGLLSAELTASNFGGGGGLLRKKTPGENDEDESQKPKSRQELIEELILKSKQEKRERQSQKGEAQELTEKLDQEWKSIQNLLVRKTPKAERMEEPEKPKLDDYDVMVRELGFEMKAQPSEKLKTPEELAKEERERLQKLEADRLKRMLGDVEENATQKQSHLSADDLNDGFILDNDDRKTLSYKDGKWNSDGGEEEGQEDEEGEEGTGEEEEEDEDGEDDGSGVDDEEDDEGEGGHSDLDSDQASGAEDEEEEEENDEGEEEAAKAKPALSEEERKAMQEAAKAELPYTFAAPESFSDLKALLDGHSAEKRRLVVERIQKCNHPSLAVGNKAKLEKLFGFLLEYVGELAMRTPPELATVNIFIPLSVLHTCLDLVKRCTLLYRQLPSYDQIFQPVRTLLAKHLPVQSYPSSLQELHREILEAIPETPSKHAPLVFEKKKPIPLRLLEPKIVQVLDYGKKRGNTKEERERERLKHKYKKEFKGALRELRKDTRFLAQAKLSDIMSRDAERKRKVKELYGSLATQEGEWKALRMKKRK
ncbi:hypothetical protein SRHO_G00235210 [Serrasalmus rhombeus]